MDGEWRSYDIFGQPVPAFDHCLGEHFLYDQLKFPLLQTMITIQYPSIVDQRRGKIFLLYNSLLYIRH